MFNQSSRKENSIIRFRRWSRKSYAIFAGLSKTINIGKVSADVTEMSLLKKALLLPDCILFKAKQEEEDSEQLHTLISDDEMVLMLCGTALTAEVPVSSSDNNIQTQKSWNGHCYRTNSFFYFKMKARKLYLLLFLLLTGTVAAQNKDVFELKEVEVQAPRNKFQGTNLRPVTTIDRIEIEQMAVSSMDDLLKLITGIDIRSRGAHGMQSDLSIRGGSFDQVMILLNGVNITDPQTGHHNLNLPLEPEDISRIEILQGAAARSLGVNAFSGAINFITNDKSESSVSGRTETGSYSYISSAVNANYKGENRQILGSVHTKRSDGHIENSDFKTSGALLQANFGGEKYGSFSVQTAFKQKDFGANSFYSLAYPNQFEAVKTFLSSLSHTQSLGNTLLRSQFYHRRHYDRFELFRDFQGADDYPWYTGHNYHRTDMLGAKVNALISSKLGKTSLTLDLSNQHIYSNVLGESISKKKKAHFEKDIYYDRSAGRFISSLHADHSFSAGSWDFAAGTALMHSKKFGVHSFSGADAAFSFSKSLRVFGAINSAVRLPTFTDLYYQSATQISNPDLRPEQSLSFELGSEIKTKSWQLAATGYHRRGKNIIDWVKPTGAEKWESRNLTRVNGTGFDSEATYHFHGIFLKTAGVSYSYLSLDKDASGFDSKYALDYLKHKVTFKLHHTILNRLSARWDYAFIDRSGDYSDPFSGVSKEYDPYALLHLKLLWKCKNFDIYTAVTNAMNRSYVDYGGIEQPGVTFTGGVRIKVF